MIVGNLDTHVQLCNFWSLPLFLLVSPPCFSGTETVAVSYFDNTSDIEEFNPLSKGLADMLITDLSNIKSINIVEHLNGSYRPGEQDRTEKLISDKGYLGIGGSDAHMVSAIGTCLTKFDDVINTEEELVQALIRKKFKSIKLEDTK